MFYLFGHKACEILAPRLGIKLAEPAMEGKVLTTRLPGKSPNLNNIFDLTQQIQNMIISTYNHYMHYSWDLHPFFFKMWCVFFTSSTSQFGPAPHQGLNSIHVTVVLDRADEQSPGNDHQIGLCSQSVAGKRSGSLLLLTKIPNFLFQGIRNHRQRLKFGKARGLDPCLGKDSFK